MDTYNLLEDYKERAARGLSVALDWEVLGMLHPLPEDYHFTRRGNPDKRYKNYPEVHAYWTAELEERARLIDDASEHPEEEE